MTSDDTHPHVRTRDEHAESDDELVEPEASPVWSRLDAYMEGRAKRRGSNRYTATGVIYQLTLRVRWGMDENCADMAKYDPELFFVYYKEDPAEFLKKDTAAQERVARLREKFKDAKIHVSAV